MNRADLRWALDSVIPHAGDSVVLESSPAGTQLYVWATDRYSAGVATVGHDLQARMAPPIICALSVSEAREVLRFIKPTRVAHETESVDTALRNDELHVAHATDSAVFDCVPEQPKGISEVLLPLFRHLWKAQSERYDLSYRPQLFARFAKAQRSDTDRLYLHPRKGRDGSPALVTVGQHFIGAIMGLTYGDCQASPASLRDVLGVDDIARGVS